MEAGYRGRRRNIAHANETTRVFLCNRVRDEFQKKLGVVGVADSGYCAPHVQTWHTMPPSGRRLRRRGNRIVVVLGCGKKATTLTSSLAEPRHKYVKIPRVRIETIAHRDQRYAQKNATATNCGVDIGHSHTKRKQNAKRRAKLPPFKNLNLPQYLSNEAHPPPKHFPCLHNISPEPRP